MNTKTQKRIALLLVATIFLLTGCNKGEDMSNGYDQKELRERLNSLQYDVTQNAGTEPPFQNEYWNLFDKGIYVDIVSGEVLFTSEDKYNSSCGWPSFSASKNTDMKFIEDYSHGMERIEVRSGEANSHLGHVFDQDPESPTGVRFCINSASLDFIPYDEMDERGYGEYKSWFKNDPEEVAYFAGGCFWGMEMYMTKVPGVKDVVSGYGNGNWDKAENPTYEEVCSGTTGFKETVKVTYDPEKLSYEMLVRAFYIAIDPTVKDRQAGDVGTQYQTGIYYTNEEQEKIANAVSDEVKKTVDVFAVEIEPYRNFYKAENYHQDYLQKNPTGYCHISMNEVKEMQEMFKE